MFVVYSPKEKAHQPTKEVFEGAFVTHPFEITQRCDIVLKALQSAGGYTVIPEVDHGLPPILAVHTQAYVDFLRDAWGEWVQRGGGQGRSPSLSPVLLASTFVPRRSPILSISSSSSSSSSSSHPPPGASVSAKMGYFSFDTGCPIVEGTYEAAYSAAQCALTSADILMRERRSVFALCRPPGHHAGKDFMGGYCYLNNASIAAKYLLSSTISPSEKTRVGILDLDYHGGNGTQDIFYDSADPLFVSIHAHPAEEYPYHVGYEEERGAGEGVGATHNFPLKGKIGDEEYLPAFLEALALIKKYSPHYIVVSFGADTSAADPLGLFSLSTAFYGKMGSLLAELNIPCLVVFEGMERHSFFHTLTQSHFALTPRWLCQ